MVSVNGKLSGQGTIYKIGYPTTSAAFNTVTTHVREMNKSLNQNPAYLTTFPAFSPWRPASRPDARFPALIP